MKELIYRTLLAGIILSIIFIILVFLIVHLYSYLVNEKRLRAFTLLGSDNDNQSFFDDFYDSIIRIIKKISKLVSKSQVLQKYALFFDKYLIYEKKDVLQNIDYISIKFLISFVFEILYILSLLIKLLAFQFMTFLAVGVLAFLLLDIVIIVHYYRKKSLIENQLFQAIVIMNSAFKSGKNIMQAVEIVQKEMPNPIKEEFYIISKDIAYGLSLEVVFNRFYERIKLNEAKYITSSLALLNKTGGNIVRVFNMIEKTFYDRLKIKNELSALTSSSKFLYRMLIAMPFIFISIIVLLNPTYFLPLVTSQIGYLIDIIILILYISYIIIIKKLTKVDEV